MDEQQKRGNGQKDKELHPTPVGELPVGIDATPPDAEAGLHYLYQEREILMAKEDIERLERVNDARVNQLDDPAEGDRTHVDERRDHLLDRLGLKRLLVRPDAARDVPAWVEEMRRPAIENRGAPNEHQFFPRVFPNIVLALRLHAPWHPATSPTPAPPLGSPPPSSFLPLPGAGVTIGVLDTGMWTGRIEWFNGRCQAVDIDPLGEDGNLTSSDGHGTFIAGIIHQHAPGARVVVHAVRAASGGYDEYVRDDDLAQAILEMAESGVDIMSLSVGGTTHNHTGLPATESAIEEVRVRFPRVVVVAAAGNDNTDIREFPAALNGVIGVAALTPDGNDRAWFSNYGEWVQASAPGLDVHSTFVDWPSPKFEGFATWSGTSFAAPAVAAAIAVKYSPGGLLQFLPFLRPKSVRHAADLLIHDPKATRKRGLGTVIRPKTYASRR